VVFVWKGNSSRDRENRWAMEAAVEYIACAPDGRAASTPILRVREGAEPLVFTCHFHAWSSRTPLRYDADIEDVRELLAAFGRSYTYEELSTGNFPKALETANLEVCTRVISRSLSASLSLSVRERDLIDQLIVVCGCRTFCRMKSLCKCSRWIARALQSNQLGSVRTSSEN
jgi:hypothetical protein